MKTFTVDEIRIAEVVKRCRYGEIFVQSLVPDAFTSDELLPAVTEQLEDLNTKVELTKSVSIYRDVQSDSGKTLSFEGGAYICRRNSGIYAGRGLYLAGTNKWLFEIKDENTQGIRTLVVSKK